MRPAVLIFLASLWIGCGSADPLRVAEDLRQPGSTVLVDALNDPDPDRRVRAALAMGRIQSSEYAPALSAAARDPELPVRLAALFALGQFGLAQGTAVPRLALETCREALGDPEAQVVALALEALGKLADVSSESLILQHAAHPSAEVRTEVAHALFRLRFAPVWRGEREEPVQQGLHAVQALSRLLADDEVGVRRAAAHACSRYGQSGAVSALERAASDADEWVRLFAIRAIGRSEGPAGLDALAAATMDGNARVRREAIAALAARGAPERAPQQVTGDESFHVRAAVAQALALLSDPRSRESLERLEADSSVTVRQAAVDALARRLKGGYALDLTRLSADEDWRVRAAVARAARHLESSQVGYLARSFDDPDLRVRLAALQAVGERDEYREQRSAALAHDDLAIRGTAVEIVAAANEPEKTQVLQQAFRDSPGEDWIEVRETIVNALAGSQDGLEFLRGVAAQDSAPSVRSRARAALARGAADLPRETFVPGKVSKFIEAEFEDAPVVVLETSKGTMEILCHFVKAPLHVASFVELARDGYYDGLIWHRVVSNFVIQGGDPRGDGWGGSGTLLRDEIHRLRYGRGAVGMPKAGKDTGGGQIFITHVPTPHLDGNYTIFGQVIHGADVIDRIEVGDAIVRAYVKQ